MNSCFLKHPRVNFELTLKISPQNRRVDFRPIFHGISEYEEKQMSKSSGFRDIGTRSPFS